MYYDESHSMGVDARAELAMCPGEFVSCMLKRFLVLDVCECLSPLGPYSCVRG